MSIKVFDEHHEVMLFWESIREFMPKTVIHVDFHADMWAPGSAINYQFAKTPGYLKKSVYSKNIYDLLSENITPTSFLIPSILRYGFEKIIFLKPTGICQSTQRITIGTLNGDGKIIRNVNEKNRAFFPDATTFEFIEVDSLKNITTNDCVLDIDMDYFCCNMNPERGVNTFVKYSNEIIDEINNYNLSRDSYGIDLELVKIENGGNYLIPQPDYLVRYNDSISWIKYCIERFVSQLPIVPKYISMCRSEKLGYTPTKYVNFIESYLKELLKKMSSKPVYPMDEPLELSEFAIIKDRNVYNYCTEAVFKLDDVGDFIITMIKRQHVTTREIIDAISESYDNESNDSIAEDIQEYIFELRRLLIIK